MASIALAAAGSAIGASLGGGILGVSSVVIGSKLGLLVGSQIDQWLLASMTPVQRIDGQRLDALQITGASEGAVIPRLYGRMRMGGTVIWATDFAETATTTRSGSKNARVDTTEYTYSLSFAVALCEGPIGGIGRIWADGDLMDLTEATWRWYPGDEAQVADVLIAAATGGAPAYRGTAYIVFEDLQLGAFGNRVPQLSFEVFCPLADADTAEGLIRAITLIPASGEFAYAPETVRRSAPDVGAENLNSVLDKPDLIAALDELEALAPEVESVTLVVSWFGDDLRAGSCLLKPGVEQEVKSTTPMSWAVNGIARASAYLISRVPAGTDPVYGGTPNDASIVDAIQELKARGFRVTFYPFILMDVPAANTLPNPYSANAATNGQAAFPWRGRITCSPAAGFTGTVDKTATAGTQVAAFLGTAAASDFAVSGETVSWTGGTDWGLRRMVLHYAHLCAAAGGVDTFVIASEMRGLTSIRSGASTYPAVAAFKTLAADVSTILGSGTKIGYAADWSEYFGHQPGDGTGDVYFNLDPLWSDANIDFVGIDNYMPLSDWRDGFEHLDAVAGAPWVHDRAYLQDNIEGGEGWDWFYSSDADRAAQTRTTITDGAASKPWVFRTKAIRDWWLNLHYDRPGGTESGSPTAWVAQSKPFRFTEFGCPAIDRGTNQPNVFVDPKSSESFVPYFSRGWRDDAIQRAYFEAVLPWWAVTANNPVSSVYAAPMLDLSECAAWTWDARPYPAFPGLDDVWADGANWRLGHWLNGRLGSVSLAALVRDLCLRAGLATAQIDAAALVGAVEGYVIGGLEAPRASIATLALHFGFDAVESQGVIRFLPRGRGRVATVATGSLVVTGDGEPFELTRGEPKELPQVLKWTVMRSDGEYEPTPVEVRRAGDAVRRIALEAHPVAVPPEEAEKRARRALSEAWTGLETLGATLPPSLLALDPSDVIGVTHDGRTADYRIGRIADGTARQIDAIRHDREIYDLPPAQPLPARLSRPVALQPPTLVFLDLPQLDDSLQAQQPLLAVSVTPWPGTVAIWRGPSAATVAPFASATQRARIGRLTAALPSGPVARFDVTNEILIDLDYGTLASITDLALFAGGNALAIETAAGVWEIVQAGTVALTAPGSYRLTRLLRGQRGTEWAIGAPAPDGARVVVLDNALVPLPVTAAEIGLAWAWSAGPAARAPSDPSWATASFTPLGRGLIPFSPLQAEDPGRRPFVAGDQVLRWVRRDRAPAADSWTGLDVPETDLPTGFAVDILSGASAVLRTLTTTTAEATYTQAQQIADLGGAIVQGDTLTIRIRQTAAGGASPNFTVALTF